MISTRWGRSRPTGSTSHNREKASGVEMGSIQKGGDDRAKGPQGSAAQMRRLSGNEGETRLAADCALPGWRGVFGPDRQEEWTRRLRLQSDFLPATRPKEA